MGVCLMYCVHCGAENDEDSIFCYQCGHKLKFRKSTGPDTKQSKELSHPSNQKRKPVKKELVTRSYSSSSNEKVDTRRAKPVEKEEELEVLTVEEFQRMKSSNNRQKREFGGEKALSKQPETEFREKKLPSKQQRTEFEEKKTVSKQPMKEFGEEKTPGKGLKTEFMGVKEPSTELSEDYRKKTKPENWQKKPEMVEAELRRKIDNLTDLISRLHEENLELEKELARCKKTDGNKDKRKPKKSKKEFHSKNKSSDDLLTRLKKW